MNQETRKTWRCDSASLPPGPGSDRHSYFESPAVRFASLRPYFLIQFRPGFLVSEFLPLLLS